MPQYTPMVIRGKGGAIPQYQQRGQHYTPGQGVSARIDPGYISTIQKAAQNNAKGLDALGNALDKAGKAAGGIADQYGKIKAMQAYRGYMEEMNYVLYNKDTGLLTSTKGENAFDVEHRIREKQQELHKKYIGDGAGSIFGIDMYFNRDAYEYDQRTWTQGMQHSASEYNRWVPQQHLAMADLYAQEAIGYGTTNPLLSQELLDRCDMHTATAMAFNGAGPAEIARALQKTRGDYDYAVANAFCAQGNWDAAEAIATGRRGVANVDVPFGRGGLTLGGSFSQGIGTLAERWKNVKYDNMDGTRDAEGRGRTDCSGLVVNTADALAASGMLGPKSLAAIRKGQTSDGIVNELSKLNGGSPLRNRELAPGMVQPGMVIGLDATSKRGGPTYGIDHIAMTFERDGRMMVFESSSGRGVHVTPYEEFYDKWKGVPMYGTTMLGDSPGATTPPQAQGAALPHSEAVDNPEGLIEPGNVDLYNRPVYDAGDGEIRTVNSITITEGDREGGERWATVLPTIIEKDGKPQQVSDQEAVAHYRKTGEHMGRFATEDDAEKFARAVHEDHAKRYSKASQPAAEDATGGATGAAGPTAMAWGRGNPNLAPDKQGQIMSKVRAGRAGEQAAALKAAKQQEEARKLQAQRDTLSTVQGWMQETAAMVDSPDARRAFLSSLVNDLDPEMQDFGLKAVDAFLKKEKDQRDRQRAGAVESAVQTIREKGMSTVEAEQYLDALATKDDPDIDRADIAPAMDLAFGKIHENPANIVATDSILEAIDTGEIPKGDVGRVLTMAHDARLTQQQRDKCLDYLKNGGKRAGVTISKVKTAYQFVAKKKDAQIPAGLYDAVVDLLPDGKAPTADDFNEAVAKAILKGTLTKTDDSGARVPQTEWFGLTSKTMPYYEAVNAGEAENWRVNVDKDEKDAIHGAVVAGLAAARGISADEAEKLVDPMMESEFKQWMMLRFPRRGRDAQ